MKNMSISPLHNVLSRYMGALSQNHEVISSNIANASTPKFRALAMQMPHFKDLISSAQNIHLATTCAGHIKGSGLKSSSSFKVKEKVEGTEEKLNGNNVNYINETLEMVRNQNKYEMVLSLYNNANKLISSAVGRAQE